MQNLIDLLNNSKVNGVPKLAQLQISVINYHSHTAVHHTIMLKAKGEHRHIRTLDKLQDWQLSGLPNVAQNSKKFVIGK